MKIYEIDEEIRTLLNNSMDEDGVIDEDKMLAVQGLSIERDKKILNFGKFLKEKEAEIKSLNNAEKRIADRRKTLENFHKRNSDFLMGLVDKKVSDAEITVSKRPSKRLVIDDNPSFVTDHPGRYIRIKEEFNKAALKKDIGDGVRINGAHIEEHYSLQIK